MAILIDCFVSEVKWISFDIFAQDIKGNLVFLYNVVIH